ncbi:hypothetical protein ASPZODRAFT_100926 [Penicilliopsis zonata CBS 506.65]|uniref:Rhodopsin domain-containing protein n=1 Tax=Penicilliopsis zonata CBS 506.65 TaxID=1073090 RepID=A0A1L9SC41_9EURO|nr:hypothetical protein ASPZODRAFT_100926 [Penicilliopsis zonata CBS 506.65]OJJ44770.1 hypothetical protein ASPZODRAFT_100926 [Penicilliopsis zonata CBS 506.65]
MGDRRAVVLGVSLAVFVVASLFVALRFVSRIFVVRRVGLHDYLMLIAWVIDLGFSLSLFYATTKGLGLHDRDISPADRPGLNRSYYAFTVLYNPALMAVKTSILVFYLTLTSGEKVFRRANYATLFIVNAAGLALTFLNVFQCNPVRAAYEYPSPTGARCTDIVTLYLSSSPVNISTDLAILFLPMPILTQMRLPKKQKYILVITFSFGFFVAVVDVIRIVYLQNAAISRSLAIKSLHLQTSSGDDLSWYASLSFMWSVVEVNVSVICACVPSLKPLVSRILPKLIRDSNDSYTPENYLPRQQLDPVAPVVIPALGSAVASGAGPLADHSANKSVPGSGGSRASEPTARTSEASLDLQEFLNAPPPPVAAALADTEAVTTNTTTTNDPAYPNITFFDFVNMRKPQSMLKLNNRESIVPNALGTILFFLWGFAYGLLDVLNVQFQAIERLDAWQSLGLHAAYFGGYLVGPVLVGRYVLKKWGFKSTFITGLCIYAIGTLVFWPSAVLTSFSAFTVSNFLVGFGLAVLETAANPFIALCGPLENSEIRLNISQGVQAIGSVLSPLLAQQVLFKDVRDVTSLVGVQWTYLGIALFDVLLALAFYYLPVPEASDEDLEELANRRQADNRATVAGFPVVWVTLALGIFSQFVYVGGQEVLSTSFERFLGENTIISSTSHFDFLTIGRSVFAAGRFLAALSQYFLKPRWILLASYIGMIVFSGLATCTTGSTATAMGICVFLFESGVFSMIFAISLRGTGKHTKTAAVLLTVAIGGGAFFPFAEYAASFSWHGTQHSYLLLVALYAAGAVFPVYLNLVPAARKQVDPIPNEYLRSRRRRRSRVVSPSTSGGENNNNNNNNNNIPVPSSPTPINNTVHREKEIPVHAGVLASPRTLVPDPLQDIRLCDD